MNAIWCLIAVPFICEVGKLIDNQLYSKTEIENMVKWAYMILVEYDRCIVFVLIWNVSEYGWFTTN